MLNSLQFTALLGEFGNAYLKHVASISPGNDLVRIVIGVVSPVSTVFANPCTYRIDLCTLGLAFLWQENFHWWAISAGDRSGSHGVQCASRVRKQLINCSRDKR